MKFCFFKYDFISPWFVFFGYPWLSPCVKIPEFILVHLYHVVSFFFYTCAFVSCCVFFFSSQWINLYLMRSIMFLMFCRLNLYFFAFVHHTYFIISFLDHDPSHVIAQYGVFFASCPHLMFSATLQWLFHGKTSRLGNNFRS